MAFTLKPFTGIYLPVGVGAGSGPFHIVIVPFTGIPVPVCKSHGSLAVHLIVFPFTCIDVPVRVFIGAPTMTFIVLELPGILTTGPARIAALPHGPFGLPSIGPFALVL